MNTYFPLFRVSRSTLPDTGPNLYVHSPGCRIFDIREHGSHYTGTLYELTKGLRVYQLPSCQGWLLRLVIQEEAPQIVS